MRDHDLAQEGEPRAGHADQQIEVAGLQPLHEVHRLAVVVQRALLNRRRN
jgi:hypothetical protein